MFQKNHFLTKLFIITNDIGDNMFVVNDDVLGWLEKLDFKKTNFRMSTFIELHTYLYLVFFKKNINM
jgi:hypothetical protein